MKTLLKILSVTVLLTVSGLLLITCKSPIASPNPDTGSVNGKAFYRNSSSHSGITISLEQSDGLRSLASISTAFSIARGARSINSVRAVLSQKQTNENGEYTFDKLSPGIYTIYASSQDSLEKAVLTNVTVEAGRAVNADDLNLTATGSISGKIILDSTETGNFGFLVCIAGTSFMAVSADNGNFIISDVPAGSAYQIIIMKGNYTALWTTTPSITSGSQPTSVGTKNVSSDEIIGGGIIWQGEFANTAALISAKGPVQSNWAYYNTSDKTSYIYNGSSWNTLAAAGAKGEDGSKGDNGEDGINGLSLIWKGEYSSAALMIAAHGPAEANWAYYNSSDKTSYIWNGNTWDKLAEQGSKGDKGDKGDTGDNGTIPHIEGGYWYVGTSSTGVLASEDAIVPHIELVGADFYWFVGEDNTGVLAQGDPGALNFYVAFNSMGGSTVLSKTLDYGDPVIQPANPTRTGFTFTGWYTSSALSTLYNFGEPVTGNFILYAGWSRISGRQFTVEFDNEDAAFITISQTIAENGVATCPANPIRTGYDFVHWYIDLLDPDTPYNFNTPVIANITLYANWTPAAPILIEGEGLTTLVEKLTWLKTNAQRNTKYIIEVTADESIGAQSLSYTGLSDIHLTLKGIGGPWTISLNANNAGSMFTVDTDVSLVLEGNLILQGRPTNNNALIRVNPFASLVIKPGVVVKSNNHAPYAYAAAGVYIDANSSFTMNGAIITGNGGTGVVIGNNSVFTMIDGEISNNTSYGGVHLGANTTFFMSGSAKISGNSGFAVNLSAADNTFTMSDNAVISGNTGRGVDINGARNSFTMSDNTVISGHMNINIYGVLINGGDSTFTMNDNAKISGFTGGNSHGVNIQGSSCTFTMNNGEISGNGGSGVYMGGYNNFTMSEFIMNNGKITGNKGYVSGANVMGGGVCLSGGYSGAYPNGGVFTMNGGEITANNITTTGANNIYGCGVYVSNNGTFNLNAGKIYDNISTTESSGVVYGGGVYVNGNTYSVNFKMFGGEIYSNIATSTGTGYGRGGGVYVTRSTGNAAFVMDGGKIYDNVVSTNNDATISAGGGVYMAGSSFTMSGGEIYGNSVNSGNSLNTEVGYGGGLYITGATTVFKKNGGTIKGYDGVDPDSNVITSFTDVPLDNQGYAVYFEPTPEKRDETAGPTDNMDSSIAGALGGWDE